MEGSWPDRTRSSHFRSLLDKGPGTLHGAHGVEDCCKAKETGRLLQSDLESPLSPAPIHTPLLTPTPTPAATTTTTTIAAAAAAETPIEHGRQ